jgi:hypothetical protein
MTQECLIAGTFIMPIKRNERVVKVTKRGTPKKDIAKRMQEHHTEYLSRLSDAGIKTPFLDSDIHYQDGIYHLRIFQKYLPLNSQVYNILQQDSVENMQLSVGKVIMELLKVKEYNSKHLEQRLGASGKPSSWFVENDGAVLVDTFPPFYDSPSTKGEEVLISYLGLPPFSRIIAGFLKRNYFEFSRQIRKTAAGAYNLSNGCKNEITDFIIDKIEELLPNEAPQVLKELDRKTFYDPGSARFKFGKKAVKILFDNTLYIPNF